jgi:hypothetical protein
LRTKWLVEFRLFPSASWMTDDRPRTESASISARRGHGLLAIRN